MSTASIIGRMEKHLTIISQGNADEDMVDVNDSRSDNTPVSEAATQTIEALTWGLTKELSKMYPVRKRRSELKRRLSLVEETYI